MKKAHVVKKAEKQLTHMWFRGKISECTNVSLQCT